MDNKLVPFLNDPTQAKALAQALKMDNKLAPFLNDPAQALKMGEITEKENDIEELHIVNKLLHAIRNICDLAGYKVECRIVLKNKKTGKEWK